jgi:hypothetical protein
VFDVVELSDQNCDKALNIISELGIVETWEKHNSRANLVGSVKTRLLLEYLDIDFHVYSDEFSIERSFAAVGEIARNKGIVDVEYKNLLDQEDKCLEWHLGYIDKENQRWGIDIIHIRNDSKYAGKFERVAEKINKVLTPEMRKTILEIKHGAYERKEKEMGINIYRAVLEGKVKGHKEYMEWKKWNKGNGIISGSQRYRKMNN